MQQLHVRLSCRAVSGFYRAQSNAAHLTPSPEIGCAQIQTRDAPEIGSNLELRFNERVARSNSYPIRVSANHVVPYAECSQTPREPLKTRTFCYGREYARYTSDMEPSLKKTTDSVVARRTGYQIGGAT